MVWCGAEWCGPSREVLVVHRHQPAGAQAASEDDATGAAGAAGAASGAPSFRTLSRAECEALLRAQHVGRLAYTVRDRVAIEPIHFVYHDGWLVGRTAPGSKLASLSHNPFVAFETDVVRALFDWESVVVRGTFYLLHARGTPTERESWERSVSLLRTLVPETFGPGDPVPFRDVPFHIHVDEITGRAATPAR
jgi:nitroimidazol reductase NimA-like FMN-containing flavoprotein (pyridoxamine 5'-phosphate oxidase superfamily)